MPSPETIFAKLFPGYEEPAETGSLTDITVGIPIKNEARGLPIIFKQLLEQKLPRPIKFTVIAVTNCSTDNSPQVIHKIAAELFSKNGGTVEQKMIEWPFEETAPKQNKTFLTVTYFKLKDNLQIIHADTNVAGKNNALNLIRHLSPDDLVCNIDADIMLHSCALAELYGALKKDVAVACGTLVPYYDHKTLWSVTRNFFLKRNAFPPEQQPFIWGGLFAYDRKKIPPFPLDLMYEDRWLTEYCGRPENKCRAIRAPHAIALQRRPGTVRDEQKETIRFMLHEVQLKELHGRELPEDFTPRLNMGKKDLLKNYYAHEKFTRPFLLGPLYNFLMSRFELHNRRLARRQMGALLQANHNDWSKIRTFAQIDSSKL